VTPPDGLEVRARDEHWPDDAPQAIRTATTLCPGWLFWWSRGDQPYEPGRGYYAYNVAEPRVLHHPDNILILIGAARQPEERP